MTGLRVDITDGMHTFHRDDEGNVTILERHTEPEQPHQVVHIPAVVWQRNWARLVSMAEMRALGRPQAHLE
jgi:hypothetical protein